MSEYIVEMKNITKRFPGIVANDNVTIQIKKGEIYALLGENGAGKSTLMSMLFGMYEPDEGEIYVRGKKEVISSPNYATELNIGMVHQHFKLVSNYTIAENIIMGVEPMKKFLGVFPYVDIKSSNQKIAALSKEYGLEVDPTKKIQDIPVSIQQRVEILKMLYREAEILIFDEPTAVLTPQEIEFLLDIIQGLKKAGKTIILITHKLEEIKKVADRCAILNRGKLIDVLDVATTSTKEMANKMVGREVNFEVDKPEPHYGNEVLSLHGGSLSKLMQFQSAYSTHYAGIKYAVENGYKKYNFYGITGDFRKENPLYGLYLFKKNFGGHVVELIGEFDLIISKFWYHSYNIAFSSYHFLKNIKKKLKK